MPNHTTDELVRYIEAAGESTNIDAKGPMEWDGGEASAGLTKDIIALANVRDGGVIVIGKDEPTPGKFVLTGVSEQQAVSFDTTKVATWVNNHCSPPITLVCYRTEHAGKLFIIVTVSEFHDVPVLCTKQFELPVPGKPSKVLIRKGAIYVRTPNAESAPLSTVEELRSLIGLATTKQGDQMLAMFQAMIKGRPLLQQVPDEERWSEQVKRVSFDLDNLQGQRSTLGRWVMSFHPIIFQEERWAEVADLKALVDKSAVRIRDSFPGTRHDFHVQEWGVSNNEYIEDVVGLARSGLFIAKRVFREDSEVFHNPFRGKPEIPQGMWIDLKWNIAQVAEFFMFMSRFSHTFEPGDEVTFEIEATPLLDRVLVSLDPATRWFKPHGPCRAAGFRRKTTLPVEVLRSAWEDQCARTLLRFFELFGGHQITFDTLLTLVGRFKNRTLWN